MSTSSDGEHSISRSHSPPPSHSYPSWLPKRPPPPAPASTFHSTSVFAEQGLDMYPPSPSHPPRRPAVPDIFSSTTATASPSIQHPQLPQGRKPTPRSVRIIARDAAQRWRVRQGPASDPRPGDRDARLLGEQAGDSAETRVVQQQQQSTTTTPIPRHLLFPPPPAHHRPQPRFRAPSLHLDLLRSPTLFMRIRYRLHPLFVFGHLILQTFFDFNALFMIIQTAKHPGPLTNPRNWNLAAAAYLACYFIQIVVIFILYELVYSFWRRWRVKRPLILPIYLSSSAHNLVGLTSYTNYCFLAYIRRSARPSFRDLFRPETPPLLPPPRSTTLSGSSSPSSLHSRPRTPPPQPTQTQTHNRSESSSSAATNTTTTSTTSSEGFLSLLPLFTPYIAESAYFLSQNTPAVLSLIPRAALCVALLLQSPAGPNLGRDSTYFDNSGSGALTAYARGVLFANAAWTLWRFVVLSGSFITLWILSGSACAGICGPRYRWEEYPDPESEVEIEEDEEDEAGWAFVNFSPWRRDRRSRHHHYSRRHHHHHSSRKRRAAGPRRTTLTPLAQPEAISISSSFFSPASPLPPRGSGSNAAVQGSEKDHHHHHHEQNSNVQFQSPQTQTRSSAYTPLPPAFSYAYYPTPHPRAYTAEDPPLSDSWNWKRGTRRRIREAWEFCLTNNGGKWVPPSSAPLLPLSGSGIGPAGTGVVAGDDATKKSDSAGSGSGNGNNISLHSEDLRGLDEVLKQSVLHQNVLLRSRMAALPPESSSTGVGLSDILPPRDDPLVTLKNIASSSTGPHGAAPGEGQSPGQFGSQRSRRSDPLRVLPFPIHVGPVHTAALPTTLSVLGSAPPAGTATAPTSAAATPATPTTATTLTMTGLGTGTGTGIPFPSPTRSRTRLGTDEEQDEEVAAVEEDEEEPEGEDEEEGTYEEEIEEYDDDFIDDDEDEKEYEDEEYEIEEGEEEEGIEEYDEDYDLTGSHRVEGEGEDLYFDEFGAPVRVVGPSRGGGGGGRRGTRTSASASGSASMSSLGRPIGGGYAFSTVGSATMSSASGSRRTGIGSGPGTGTGSRMGTVSSRGTRAAGSRSASVSASASASANNGTRSSRGSGSARAPSSSVSRSVSGRGRGRGRGSTGMNSVAGSVSASPQSQQQQQTSPQSAGSGSGASPLNSSEQSHSQSSPDSQNQNQSPSEGHAFPPPLSPATSTSRTTPRPLRERRREFAGPSSRLRVPGSPSHNDEAGGGTDAGNTSLDFEYPVPVNVYSATGGRSRRTSSTAGRTGTRTRTRTMSSGFSGGEFVLPMPMPEGYEEEDAEETMSQLGRARDMERGSLAEDSEGENENQDILGLLSPSSGSSRPASNSNLQPPPLPQGSGSGLPSASNSASASLHTRSPRSSLKSLGSRSPSLANLAASLGAGLSAGVRHLGSRRVSFTGAGAGSRSGSREGRASSHHTTPPPPPLPVQSQLQPQQSQTQIMRTRAQSLIQSIRNRSSSFVELIEMGDDDEEGHGLDEGEDVTVAFGPGTAVGRRPEDEDDVDVESEALSSPEHSSNHSPEPHNYHPSPPASASPLPQRLIGVPRGFDFGSRRESSGSGTASSVSPSSHSGVARLSEEGRRPLSMLSAMLGPALAGSEGTFGRPGELADVVRRELESERLLENEGHTNSGVGIPEEGTVSRSPAIPIPSNNTQRRHSPSPISTAPASFITAPPSVAQTHSSTTESVARGPGESGSGTEEQSSGSAGASAARAGAASSSIDPLWRDQTRRGARGPVAGSWHLGPA